MSRAGWARAATGLFAAACATPSAEIPPGPPVAEPAVHAVRVAVLPLADGRGPDEAPDEDGEYVYRGRVFRGTNLDWLKPTPMAHVTLRFAEALARTGLFAEIVLVREPFPAEEYDLVLRGRVKRARGYVESDPEGDADPWALSEVVFDQLRLEDAATGALRFAGATGWTIWERRAAPVDPWGVLAETLDQAVGRLRSVLATADLEEFVVEPSVSLPEASPSAGRLSDLVPPGWEHARTSSATRPRGWEGEPRCVADRYAQRQAFGFHRLLGPHVPTVETWTCPVDVRLVWSSRVELPAELLGTDPAGRWVFGSALGRSNWSKALEDLARAMSLDPPRSPYVVEIGPDATRALEPVEIPTPKVGRRPSRTPVQR